MNTWGMSMSKEIRYIGVNKMKYLLVLSLLISTNCFAYIYAETGDYELDALSNRMQQQDNEDRLSAIESNLKQQQQDQLQKDLFDSVNR